MQKVKSSAIIEQLSREFDISEKASFYTHELIEGQLLSKILFKILNKDNNSPVTIAIYNIDEKLNKNVMLEQHTIQKEGYLTLPSLGYFRVDVVGKCKVIIKALKI